MGSNEFGEIEMRIGVITFHRAKQSYGAYLQAYATVTYLREQGHDVEIVNYVNQYEQRQIKDSQKSLKEKVLMRLNWFIRMFLFGGIKSPYVRSAYFDRLYGSMTPLIRSDAMLDTLQYDVLLAGSDQIWNPDITDGVDRAFLLDFGTAKKRISYASSIGSHYLTESEKIVYRDALSRFSAISVRESFAKEELSKVTDAPIEVVLDPTLLLTKEEWLRSLCISNATKEKNSYILTYFVGANIETYWSDIAPYVAAFNLPVYNIQSHAHRSTHTDKALYGMEIAEMLRYINNAAVVITDSFHGTAFSINFGRQFISVPNRKNPLRVQNLLNVLRLQHQMMPSVEEARKVIEYPLVNERLAALREASCTWLNNAIEGE